MALTEKYSVKAAAPRVVSRTRSGAPAIQVRTWGVYAGRQHRPVITFLDRPAAVAWCRRANEAAR